MTPPRPRLLTDPEGTQPQTLEAYRATGGYRGLGQVLAAGDPESFRNAVDASGLRGRGGACFPTGRKWHLAAAAEADQCFVVANGGEHEPGSEKDKHLVARYPHSVLEGMLLCGYATGATKGYLYLIEDMDLQVSAGEAAIAEARQAGLLGADIQGTGFSFDVEIHKAPTTYVAGEESAALDSIEGGPGKPRTKPPYPGEAGLWGKPTTVNNVETLAHAAWIAREGAEAFASIGTEHSKGTMLFTLGAEVARPGVYERPFGISFRELIEGAGGGLADGKPVGPDTVRAIHPAMSAAFLGPEHLDAPICVEGLKELGSSPGSGGVRVVRNGDDVVALLQHTAKFFMDEQCGQCPACRMATNQFVHILGAVQAAKGPGYDAKLRKLAKFNRGKGKCSLIEMASAPVISGLDVFSAELADAAGPAPEGA